MTEPVVERTQRETSWPSTPRTVAAWTGRQLAVRGLVVAGFAGGAWLLCSSAAHAAEGHATGATDSTVPVAHLVTGFGGHTALGLVPQLHGAAGTGQVGGTAAGGPAAVPDGAPAGRPATDLMSRVLIPSETTTLVSPGRDVAAAVSDARSRRAGSGFTARGIPSARSGSTPLFAFVTNQVAAVRCGPAGEALRLGWPMVRSVVGGAGITVPQVTVPGVGRSSAPSSGRPAADQVSPTATAQPAHAAQPAGGNGVRRLGHLRGAGADRNPALGLHRADRIGSRHGPVPLQPAPFEADRAPRVLGMSTGSAVSHHRDGLSVIAANAVTGTPIAGSRSVRADDAGRRRPVAEDPTVSPD